MGVSPVGYGAWGIGGGNGPGDQKVLIDLWRVGPLKPWRVMASFGPGKFWSPWPLATFLAPGAWLGIWALEPEKEDLEPNEYFRSWCYSECWRIYNQLGRRGGCNGVVVVDVNPVYVHSRLFLIRNIIYTNGIYIYKILWNEKWC